MPIELDCPGCNQQLELDAGFAGSVCRCFACGMLMTVPKDSALDQAEALQRPESPELPVESVQSARPEFPTEAASPTVYATASGKTIRISDLASIPVARQKRVVVRATTATLFIALTAALVGLCVFVGILLLRSSFSSPVAIQNPTDAALEELGYDPQVNPFRLDHPNLLGLPFQDQTVILIDASRSSRRWLALVKEAIEAGFTTSSGAGRTVGLIYATEEGGIALDDSMQALQDQDRFSLIQFQAKVEPTGQADLRASLDQALTLKPKHLMLVLGRQLDPNVFEDLENKIRQSTLVLDVIMINQEAPELAQLAEQTGGQAVVLSGAQIRAWFRQRDDADQ